MEARKGWGAGGTATDMVPTLSGGECERSETTSESLSALSKGSRARRVCWEEMESIKTVEAGDNTHRLNLKGAWFCSLN